MSSLFFEGVGVRVRGEAVTDAGVGPRIRHRCQVVLVVLVPT